MRQLPRITPAIPSSMTTHQRVMAAISILQARMLADESPVSGEDVWGAFHLQTPSLELAIQLLIDTLPEVEKL